MFHGIHAFNQRLRESVNLAVETVDNHKRDAGTRVLVAFRGLYGANLTD